MKIEIRGSLRASRAREVFRMIQAAAKARPETIELDLASVDALDTAGVATVRVAQRLLTSEGIRLELVNVPPRLAPMFDVPALGPPVRPVRPGVLESIGLTAYRTWASMLELAAMTVDLIIGITTALSGRQTFRRGTTIEQVSLIGIDALPIIGMLSFLLGTVLAFQTWVQLREFGAEVWVSHLVGIGMAREFGCFIVAIILAGRSGSAIAAELATMEMREENDALRVLGISPVEHLVVPRMLAMTVVAPGLTLLATAIGITGGLFVTHLLGVPFWSATTSMAAAMTMNDVALGLVKSVLFGWVIGISGTFTGLHSGAAARSVGSAATRAVVASIFFIIVIDSIVTTAWTVST